MEDQEGGVATPRKEEFPPIKRKSDRKKRLTVMIMGSIGRVVSFQISSALFLWSTIFFIAYIIFSLYIIHDHVRMRWAYEEDRDTYGKLEVENSTNRKLLNKSRQHIALLESYIRHLEEGTDFSTVGREPRGSEAKAAPAQAELSEKSSKPSQVVDVTDMVIQKEGSSISITLKLVNLQPGEGAVGGYLHLIALDTKSAPPKEWCYPQEKLENGMPANYRKGQIFLIQKFKQINARFISGAPSPTPSTIKVLAYDQSGEIILQKEMAVTQS